MMAASTSRRLQLLIFLVTIVCSGSNSAVFGILVPANLAFNNSACDIFTGEKTCVGELLTDNNAETNYKFAFVNHIGSPDAYLLSIVWTVYQSSGLQYQRGVWSANRNRPVNIGAKVTLVANGSLVLYDGDGSEVWSTKTDGKGAMGLDLNSTTGELTVYGQQNQTIWSTFSHPTDTIVAGQQLVWGMQLVNSLASTNSLEGGYSLVMEPTGLVLYASLPDTQPYLVWNIFAQSEEAMPVSSLLETCQNPVTRELRGNGQLALSITDPISSLNPIPRNSQNYRSQALCNLTSNYSTIEMASYPTSANATFMVLESDGNLRVYVFNLEGVLTEDYNFFNATQCDLPGICGGYGVCKANGAQCECPSNYFLPISSDPTGGCSYNSGSPGVTTCGASARVNQVTAVDYYSNRFSASTSINTSTTECENLCLNNCSCTASFYNSLSEACYLVTEPLLSMISTNNSILTAFLKISDNATEKKRSRNFLAVWIGVVASCFIVVLMGVLCLVACLSRKKARMLRNSNEDEFLETLTGLPPRFSVKELHAATKGFARKLGSGGFGTVYEGTLKDGSKIAVKKLDSSRSTKDFRAEMATLGSIHHINLVRLRGFCVEGLENMLVYEHMPNGSLDRWLFTHESESAHVISKPLTWETRFKIALGTARGLTYLHEECSERIIHLDIKPQNILVDESFNPKVTDFGLSKLVNRDMTSMVTTMRGTPGYLAPEWLLRATITEKTDVYSYGIVLLELVAGRKCLDISKPDPNQPYVPAWLLRCKLGGNILDIVDARLNIKDMEEQVMTVIHVALHCIQEELVHRPSMAEVVQMLEGLVKIPNFQRDVLHQILAFKLFGDRHV